MARNLRRTGWLLAAVLALCVAPCLHAADDERLKKDLESLQGRWERATGGSQPGREVLEIEGDRETYALEQADGTVVRKLTATIELARNGDVEIYTRSKIKVVSGSRPLGPPAESQSFVYKLDQDVLYEVIGLLHDRTPSRKEPGVVRWQRPAKEPVPATRSKSP